MISWQTLGYALLGGVLPALIWLYFLLKEDAKHPEPRRLIILAFLAGMLGVPLVLPLEELARSHFVALGLTATALPILISWAAAEEVIKYAMAAIFILWRRAVDEAPDYVVYMFTVALGFAAAENALFLFAPLASGHFLTGLQTDNLRFVGSTLLHVFASSMIGFALAFSRKKSPATRTLYAACGLILATALHTAFNALIISGGAQSSLTAFFLVWSAAVFFFAIFEILKYFQARRMV